MNQTIQSTLKKSRNLSWTSGQQNQRDDEKDFSICYPGFKKGTLEVKK